MDDLEELSEYYVRSYPLVAWDKNHNIYTLPTLQLSLISLFDKINNWYFPNAFRNNVRVAELLPIAIAVMITTLLQ